MQFRCCGAVAAAADGDGEVLSYYRISVLSYQFHIKYHLHDIEQEMVLKGSLAASCFERDCIVDLFFIHLIEAVTRC